MENQKQPNKVVPFRPPSELDSRRSNHSNLNGSYFRMGLVLGLAIAAIAVWLTYEIMS